MAGTSAGRIVIDIMETVRKHVVLCEQLLAAHALFGCDTVSYMCGIGKGIVLKVLSNGYIHGRLGRQEAHMVDVLAESTKIIGICYGSICQSFSIMFGHKKWPSPQ